MFYTLEFAVDTFQNVKKTLTDRVIVDPVLNKVAHNYINSQTDFAKMLIGNGTTITKEFFDRQTEYWFPKKG